MRRALLAATLVAALAAPGAAGAKPWHGTPTLTCGGSLTFKPAAFHNPTGAEAAATPQAQALRDHLRAQREAGLPTPPDTGWRVLAESADQIVFHRGRPDSQVALTFVLIDGGWRIGASGCTPRRFARGYEVASVVLRPGHDRRSRSLRVSVQTGRCSAIPPARRLQVVGAAESRHSVTLVALLKPEKVPPFVACPSVVALVPARAHLVEPLGRRAVRDGSVHPPRMLGRAPR